ncbi:hypothetical protein H4582DRAFT_1021788 [Lactarius indigo]|nr:hypothetical protein H4582DRAFT_1021788 [Lactarius indigo]
MATVCPVSPAPESNYNLPRQATSPPPSPSVSPPSLLQSSSSSTADPPTNTPRPSPHTPPPRGRSRYPSGLAHGGPRVPLHRRGTSKTYERLEDLLQEAGYKETRVFTPETERLRERELGQGERRQMDGRVRSGMDTVVGYLAGLVLGQSDNQRADAKDSQNEQMVRASPSAQQPRPSSSHGEPCGLRGEYGVLILLAPPGPTTDTPLLQTRGPLRSDGATYERSSAVLASPARAYLRHIASAPNIPRRRLPGEHTPPPVIKKSTTSLKDGLNAQGSPPPMPPSWLETVTRAVLGFHGAHIRRNDTASPGQSRFGLPSHPASRSGTVRGYGRSTRKRLAAVLGDATATQRGRSTPSLLTSPVLLQPPTMLSVRSQASIGEVIKMNAVCRSAPASRSSSVAGRKPRDESLATASLGIFSNGSVRRRNKALQPSSRNFRRKTGRNHVDCGPSLRVRVEDDGSTFHIAGEREDYDSSSEDEDEVDLSKLLVHPRRQQSIKSLRHQLSRSHCRDNNASGIAGPWAVRGDDDSALTPDGKGRIRRGSVNDGDWGAQVPPGSYSDSQTSHRRREIPVSWTQQGGSSGDKSPGPTRRRER